MDLSCWMVAFVSGCQSVGYVITQNLMPVPTLIQNLDFGPFVLYFLGQNRLSSKKFTEKKCSLALQVPRAAAVRSVGCCSQSVESWRLCQSFVSHWGVCWAPAAKLVKEMTACYVSLHNPRTDSLKAWSQTNRGINDARYHKISLPVSLTHSPTPTHTSNMHFRTYKQIH